MDKLFKPKKNTRVGISVTLDSEVISFVDKMAKKTGLNRSEIINRVLVNFQEKEGK